MNKVFALFACLLCLFSCNPNTNTPKNTIIIGIEAHPQNLDPRIATNALAQKINHLVFNGLVKTDKSLNLVPDLAQSYKIVTPTKYEFQLRSDVFFHNGKKLTSTDIKASYKSYMNKDNRSPFGPDLAKNISAIKTPDANHITFILKEPQSSFLTRMALPIFTKEQAEKTANNTLKDSMLYGTGPFAFAPQESSMNNITLNKFEKHFSEKAKSDHLIFRVLQDHTLRTFELIKGRIDILQNNVPYNLIPAVKKEQQLDFSSVPGVNFNYMAFNLNRSPLNKTAVRKAIALALPVSKLITYKLMSMAEPATSVLSPAHWVFNKTLKPLQQNLNQAKKLLDQAGLTDPDGNGPLPRFKLTYKTSSNKERVEIALLIAEELRKVGIEVNVESYEFGTFFRDIRQGDFDLYTLTWVGITDPAIYDYIFHSRMVPPNGGNRGSYINKNLDQLLEQADQELDPEKYKTLYQKIQRISFDDFPYAPLWYENNFAFYTKNLKDFELWPNASFKGLIKAHKE
ncbi:MAG: ABC transporter substrate-binding protein [Deltaproteobacteria bacterium]|nr:ABC transporter substrate-binding protein [Deltaproteobacteria bacterium]